jgi:transcription elongation factor Elf1
MIQIIAYESGFCPECSEHTNSVLELEEYRNADVLSCNFCGYEEEKFYLEEDWDMSIDEILR